MLQIERIKLELTEDEMLLRQKAAAALRIPMGEIETLQIFRKSIDAREGVRFAYTLRVSVKNEGNVLKRCRNDRVSKVNETLYRLPPPVRRPEIPPVVAGAGPAGLFCALALARCGAPPPPGCRAVLGNRGAGSGIQCAVRRGGRRGLL